MSLDDQRSGGGSNSSDDAIVSQASSSKTDANFVENSSDLIEEQPYPQRPRGAVIKSLRSLLSKATKPFPSLLGRRRRSVDLSCAVKSSSSGEDALFLTGSKNNKTESKSRLSSTLASSSTTDSIPGKGCVCVRYSVSTSNSTSNLSNNDNSDAAMAENRNSSSSSSSPPRIQQLSLEQTNSTRRQASQKKTDSSLSDQTAQPLANFQVDYVNYLIPGQTEIANCPFYWGKMDRYEAEALLANKPEGSFLLRDSAQDEYVFSVSFRRYSRSLHARIEEYGHKFSFDSHDPGVHAASTVRGLLDHYKDPSSCMFFEPMLLYPVMRKSPFSLQSLARSVICDNSNYNDVAQLPLPKTLHQYLREYHYRQKIRSRNLEAAEAVASSKS